MRKFFQLRLATILFLVFLMCVVLGVYSIRKTRAQKQQAAVEEITNRLRNPPVKPGDLLPGHSGPESTATIYDYEYSGSKIGRRRNGVSPSWLTNWFGIDFIHNVSHADIVIGEIELLKSFPGLTSVTISAASPNPAFTQAAWDELASNRNLESIELKLFCRIKTDFNPSFGQWDQLEEFKVTSGHLIDEDFDALVEADSLKDLTFRGVWLCGDFDETGTKIPQVETLCIRLSGVPSKSSNVLARFTNLRELTFKNDNTANLQKSIELIGSMNTLETLDVSAFVGMDLSPLDELPALRELSIDRSALSMVHALSFTIMSGGRAMGSANDVLVQQKLAKERLDKVFEAFQERHPDCRVVLY